MLNNMGLNSTGPLICRFFFSVNIQSALCTPGFCKHESETVFSVCDWGSAITEVKQGFSTLQRGSAPLTSTPFKGQLYGDTFSRDSHMYMS